MALIKLAARLAGSSAPVDEIAGVDHDSITGQLFAVIPQQEAGEKEIQPASSWNTPPESTESRINVCQIPGDSAVVTLTVSQTSDTNWDSSESGD